MNSIALFCGDGALICVGLYKPMQKCTHKLSLLLYMGIKLRLYLVFVRKRVKALETLIGLMEKFPHDDAQAEDLLENVGKVRAKFRQVRSTAYLPHEFSVVSFP